jgi:hypothetical protein
MQYTKAVEDLIADPLCGRTEDEVHALAQGEIAQHALAHMPDPAMLRKFAKDHGVTLGRATALFEETKRFLTVGRLVGAKLAPSPDIDDMWHAWILYTKDYHAFCERLGSYIHHKPLPKGSPEQPPLEPTLALIEAAFGAVDEGAWPLAAGPRGGMDCKMGA